jgi:hypothetical protein
MDWEALLKSVVVAASISGVVAVIGFIVSAATAQRINKDKLKLDKQLAEQKAAADLTLAERKTELDRKLALAKRRAEVAEKVLTEFYKVQRAFELIRSPAIWAAEVKPEEGVAQDIIENDGYGVVRRLRENASFFSELEATRFTFGALFGVEAAGAYQAVIKLHNQVFHAAEAIVRYRNDDPNLPGLRDFLPAMRKVAFSGRLAGERDLIEEEVAEVIAKVEAVCQPALESELAAEAAGRKV